MDAGQLRAQMQDAIFGVLSVPATILPSIEDDPVAVEAIWVSPTTEAELVGDGFRGRSLGLRRNQERVLAIRVSGLPKVQKGTVIVAPERAGAEEVTRRWVVDGISRVDAHLIRYIVVPEAEVTAVDR